MSGTSGLPADERPMSDLSDAELLALFRKEDSRHYAFNLLVRQYQTRLYSFIRRMVNSGVSRRRNR